MKLVERAAIFAGDDCDRLGVKFRGAPAWWLEKLNVARRSRGLTPVVVAPRRTRSKATPAPAPAAPPDRQSGGLLAIRCCSGVSLPTAAAGDPERLPEFIEPGAFAGFLADLKAGRRSVDLRVGHEGGLLSLATTRDGTLRLMADPAGKAGLLAEADVEDAPWARITHHEISLLPRGCPVSVAIVAEKFRHADRCGRKVRVVSRARIDHVALLLPRKGATAAFPDARAVAVPKGDPTARCRIWERLRGVG